MCVSACVVGSGCRRDRGVCAGLWRSGERTRVESCCLVHRGGYPPDLSALPEKTRRTLSTAARSRSHTLGSRPPLIPRETGIKSQSTARRGENTETNLHHHGGRSCARGARGRHQGRAGGRRVPGRHRALAQGVGQGRQGGQGEKYAPVLSNGAVALCFLSPLSLPPLSLRCSPVRSHPPDHPPSPI